MYICESWTVKKAEHQRIYAFLLWCWRRLLKVPWTAGTSNQSILREITPECSLEGLMLSDANGRLIRKVPDAGEDGGQKEKRVSEDEMAGRQHWWNEHELGQTPGNGEGQGGLTCCSLWGHKVRHDWVTDSNVHYVHMYLHLLCMYLVFNTYTFLFSKYMFIFGIHTHKYI